MFSGRSGLYPRRPHAAQTLIQRRRSGYCARYSSAFDLECRTAPRLYGANVPRVAPVSADMTMRRFPFPMFSLLTLLCITVAAGSAAGQIRFDVEPSAGLFSYRDYGAK